MQQNDNGNKVVLTITLDRATGNVTCTGPIEDKILSYGLLRVAEEIITTYKPGAAIVPPSPQDVARINRNSNNTTTT